MQDRGPHSDNIPAAEAEAELDSTLGGGGGGPSESTGIIATQGGQGMPFADADQLASPSPDGRGTSPLPLKTPGACSEEGRPSYSARVAPGESIQAAVDAVPDGAAILLLPGVHELGKSHIELASHKAVHLHGEGAATLAGEDRNGSVVVSRAGVASRTLALAPAARGVRFGRA